MNEMVIGCWLTMVGRDSSQLLDICWLAKVISGHWCYVVLPRIHSDTKPWHKWVPFKLIERWILDVHINKVDFNAVQSG